MSSYASNIAMLTKASFSQTDLPVTPHKWVLRGFVGLHLCDINPQCLTNLGHTKSHCTAVRAMLSKAAYLILG